MALSGESIILPLGVWTPVIIILSLLYRIYCPGSGIDNLCSINFSNTSDFYNDIGQKF